MGTTPADTGPSRRQVYHDLFDELAYHRHAEHAGEMTEALLSMERDGNDLVGLTDDHQRAVYYSSTGRSLNGYRFDQHGVHQTDIDAVWRLLSDAASWVDANQDELDWIHPHFRWVLNLEEDCSGWAYWP